MDSRALPSALISKRLACATLCIKESGAVVRFYIRHDFLLMHDGTCSVRRAEVLGEIELEDDEFRLRKPRRLYEVSVEGTSVLGGERDG